MPWIGGAIAAGATLLGSSMQSDSAQSAANTQAQATQAGIGEQQREFDLTRSDTAPYRGAGTSAIGKLQELLGLKQSGTPGIDGTPPPDGAMSVSDWARQQGYDMPTGRDWTSTELGNLNSGGYQKYISDYSAAHPESQPQNQSDFGSLNKKFSISDFWNDPVVQASYQSGLDLGTKALKNAAPLTTGLDSGAALKELTKFGTDYTGNMASGSQARYVGDQNTTFNRLAGLAGVGQTAVNTSAASGANTANNVSNMLTAQGNAQGASQIAGANAWAGGLNSISNWWNQNQMVDKMLQSRYPMGGGFGGVGASPY